MYFMKKLLSFILAISMIFSLAAVRSITASADEYEDEVLTSGDFEYIVRNGETIWITGYNGSAENLVIPNIIDNKMVCIS